MIILLGHAVNTVIHKIVVTLFLMQDTSGQPEQGEFPLFHVMNPVTQSFSVLVKWKLLLNLNRNIIIL